MKEGILASNEQSRNVHRGLYHYAEGAYIIVDGGIINSIDTLTKDINRLHIAATWRDLISLSVWKEDPKTGDLFVLLKKIGIRTEELLLFKDSDIGDLLPWLYYGKRFEVLRKICRTATVNVENHMSRNDIRVCCHLTSEEPHCIIASSL
ncbi:MAG TPA: hypothetical protein DCP92_09765 [Nitrospiraceae bacterium]|jgi:hypothetical protein|nr:hypothetical protein [Nitrospiraceae bacterium]